MPINNPLNVTINVTTDNTIIYVMPTTFASWTQKVTVTFPDGTVRTAQGSGEGNQLAIWSYPVNQEGPFIFQVYIEHNDGSGFQDNSWLAQSSFSAYSMHTNWVLSEDSSDNDLNDCFVTFVWFKYWEMPNDLNAIAALSSK